jgi:uncharacterized membrane protein
MLAFIGLGVWFRLVHLDLKPYWHDEVFTLLRVSGYRAAEAVPHLFNGQVIGVDELLHYQRPAAETGALGTIWGLATEEPQHPPLYYLTARFWAEQFGSSIAVTRALPALLSLLGFPALYWLCLELFSSPAVGLLAVGFYSVSPIYIRYAQEARQYSLWIVLIMLSSAALLRAMRQSSRLNWCLYGLTVITSLYCHFLSIAVILAHGVYVLISERGLSRRFAAYALAAGVGVLTFIPWLWIVWSNQSAMKATTGWMKDALSLPIMLEVWGISLSRAFVAWHLRYNPQLVYLAIPIFVLVLYAIYFLCRHTAQRSWLLVVILISTMIAALVIPDVLLGGRRSSIERYFLPSYLGIHLTVAFLLAAKLFGLPGAESSTRSTNQWRWRALTVCLFSISILTCAVSAKAETWWGWSEFDAKIPAIVNQAERPLIVSDMAIGNVMPLAHRLRADAGYLLTYDPATLQIPTDRPIFAYNPSEPLLAQIQKYGSLQEVYQFRDAVTGLVISLYELKV